RAVTGSPGASVMSRKFTTTTPSTRGTALSTRPSTYAQTLLPASLAPLTPCLPRPSRRSLRPAAAAPRSTGRAGGEPRRGAPARSPAPAGQPEALHAVALCEHGARAAQVSGSGHRVPRAGQDH